MDPARDPIAHLRQERRSFILGTVLVWIIIAVTVMLLFVSMEPQLWQQPPVHSYQQAKVRAQQMPPLSGSEQIEIRLVVLLGAVALFFLNWRFSIVLQRPRGAFVSGGVYPAGRWLWWTALALNSYIFISQIVMTPLLAHWATQEIGRRAAAPSRSPQE